MKDVEQISIRFRANNEDEYRAWHNLKSVNKEKYATSKEVIVKAINKQYDRESRSKDDPYLENREREEEFIQRITDGVMKKVTEELPFLLSGFLVGYLANYGFNSNGSPNIKSQNMTARKGDVGVKNNEGELDVDPKLLDMKFIF